MYRLKRMAQLAEGKILDIGYAWQPNPFLKGEVFGFDREQAAIPSNYTDVFSGDVSELKSWHEQYDTVVAGEIIEHLDDPLEFLDACRCVLRPGGKLIMSTPNPYHPAMFILESLMLRRYFYHPEHVNIFLPRFLVRMMERCGFTSVKTYSGGMVIAGREIPFPKPICYAIIYVGIKS